MAFLLFVRWIRSDNVATRRLHCVVRPTWIDVIRIRDDSKRKKSTLEQGNQTEGESPEMSDFMRRMVSLKE